MPIRALLAEHHTLVRSGIRALLEGSNQLTVVGEASEGRQAVELTRQLRPDLVLMDIGMPELNGIEATAQILKRCPNTAVLILSMYSDERYVVRAVKAGARGYLLKNSAGEELIQAVQAVQAGTAFFSPAGSRWQSRPSGADIP